MNNVEVKNLYKEIASTKTMNFVDCAREVIRILKLTCSVDDVLQIGLKLEGEELQAFIKKHNLYCPVCNTAEHLVCEPVVWNTEAERYTMQFEIYCANPDPNSSIFSKCWHHVYGYYYGIQQGVEKCMEFSKLELERSMPKVKKLT